MIMTKWKSEIKHNNTEKKKQKKKKALLWIEAP